MLQKLLNLFLLKDHPVYGIVLGFFAVTIGMLVATFISPSSPSIVGLFFATLAIMPVTFTALRRQEVVKVKEVLPKYKKLAELYFYLFFGMALAFAFWFTVLPEPISSWLFEEQIQRFAIGYFSQSYATLFSILINNLGLVFLFFILSIVYGMGSLFLLSWNASILGLMWGNAMRALIFFFDKSTFFRNTIFILPYMLPEVAAYFIAAIAGGIIYVNIIKKQKIQNAIKDSLVLLNIAIALIILAAGIETVMLAIF